MRPRFDPRAQRAAFSGPRTNHRIRVPEVRVIGAEGEMLGVLPTHEALRLAKEKELDLVEVNPKGMPPVCKIMDFGKFKYEEKKKENEAKKRQIQVELKEVKLRPKTDDHDMDVKTRHVRRFLEEGNKVKVTCRFRGREITHPETAERQLIEIIEKTRDIGVIEQPPRMEGKTMTILIAPKPEIRARVAAQAAQAAKKAAERPPAKVANGQSKGAPVDEDLDDEDDDDEDDEDDDDDE
ncbi:translation initiation factor IF-3 [Sandaracinus amylolyticus]|nr:translation initiation factor IF-3 [Sandaracinus amylolyticus]